MNMGKFQYHYSKGHRTALSIIVIVVIVAAAAAFVLWNGQKNIPAAVVNQTNNTSQLPEGTITQPNTTNITADNADNNTQPPVIEPAPNATNETGTTPPAPPPAQSSGLTAEFYTTTTLAGDVIAAKIVPNVDFTWSDSNQPADGVDWKRFSARFSGTLLIDKEGDYTFIITSDDGSRLYIDGTNVADIWESTGVSSKSTFRKLAAGEHTVRVDYRNIGGGSAKVKLEYWASALNISRQVIPTGNFRP